ncbi:13238_t:CDS:2 [Acaulospora morrowiae]|uniref:13238_t:CDS:1 n=1 Tax=Acaulospora morrowiae TaxID=94023 RepID=A0A9N8V608_9GLOM|nr:13238_t:CDS:2 [Acaulospora morrowiae]
MNESLENDRIRFGNGPSSIAYNQTTSDYSNYNNDSDPSSYHNSPTSLKNHSVLSGGEQTIMSTTTNATTSILPPDHANINFKPTATAISKVTKLKLHVSLDSTIYTAGGILTGRLELVSTTSRSLKLGEISCELTAYEELNTREYTASQSFLSSRLVFQSATLPPSNAVHGPPDNGYWTAKKGKTTFPFSFKIPVDAPSSVEYGNGACLRYIVTGVIQFLNNNKQDSMFKAKEAFVVEAWDAYNPLYKQPIDAVNMKQLWMGGSGAITLESTLVETLFQSGGNVSIKVRVKNDTKRRVQGLKVSITHRLLILANKAKKEIDQVKAVGETVKEEWFKGKDFLFDCGEDRSTIVHINVPNNVRTIRNTALFEVVCYIIVSLYLGPFTKDLSVQLPVYIAHSASLQPPPMADTDLNHFPNHYNMMDESADFFIEDIRQDDNEVLEYVATPVSIPSKKGTRILPWTNGDDDYKGHYSPRGSFGSGMFGSASPKKLSSLASSFLGRPKQMTPSSPSKLIAKSPPLAPASPYAYIPAIERVRYLSFSTQEQNVVQKRPYTPQPTSALGSAVNGFGVYSGSQASEYEFGASPPPTKAVQKWLENQNTNDQADSSSIVTPPLSEPVEQSAKSTVSPWSHVNRTQEIMNISPKSQSPKSGLQGPIAIPVQNTSKLPDSTFQRSNSIVSSPSGPSGLTLLMKQKSSSPSVIDHTFEEKQPVNSGDSVLKERNISKEDEEESIVIIDENNVPKSDFLQVPGTEQDISRQFPPASTSGAIGNISALLRWGGSWIGYSNDDPNKSQDNHDATVTNNDSQNKGANDERPRKALPSHPEYASDTSKIRAIKVDQIMDIIQNDQTFDEDVRSEIPDDDLIKGRPRRTLPPPPEDATNTRKARAIKINEIVNIAKNGQDIFGVEMPSTENSSQVTSAPIVPVIQDTPVHRPRRNLPPIPTKPLSLISEAPSNVMTDSNKSKVTIENEIALSSKLADATSEINTKSSSPPVPPKPPKLAASPPKSPKTSKLVSSPPKPPKPTVTKPNQNPTKASIFMSLGQKKSGLADNSVVPSSSAIQGGISSPPKQTGFNVPRKPVSRNNILNIEEEAMNTNKFGNDDNRIESKDDNRLVADVSKNSVLTDNAPSTGPSSNVNSGEISLSSPKFEESKNSDKDPFGEIIIPSELINPSPPPKTSLPTTSSTPISTTNLTRKKTFSQHKLGPMLPTLPQTILTNPHNENMIIEEESVNETSKFSSSPISQYSKITSTSTTYVNTTIAKPVVISPLLQKSDGELSTDIASNKTVLKTNKKNKKLVDDNDENRLTFKIIEPPKQVLSPRLQEYISKYNRATSGGN